MIDTVLGDRACLSVMQVLHGQDDPLTGRGLWQAVKDAGGPSGLGSVQQAIRHLAEAGVIETSPVPYSRAKIHRLSRNHPLVLRLLRPVLALEQQHEPDIGEALRLWLSPDAKALGVHQIVLEQPDEPCLRLRLHVLLLDGDAEAGASAMGWLEQAVGLVATPRNLEWEIVRHTYQSIREDSASAQFRSGVIENGVVIAGSGFAHYR